MILADSVCLLFGPGCYDDEGGARWLRRRASIYVGSTQHPLRLNCTAQVLPDTLDADATPQMVRMSLDGEVLFEHRFASGRPAVVVNLDVPARGTLRQLVIETARAIVPSDQGREDIRELALFVYGWRCPDGRPVLTFGPLIPADEPCDVCGSFADRVITEGESLQTSLDCLVCGATTRERTYVSALGRSLANNGPLALWPQSPAFRLLEISGTMAHATWFASWCGYVGLRDARALSAASGRWPRAELAHLPFGDEAFDVAMTSGAFNGASTGASVSRELHRVLRPRGIALIQLPVSFIQNASVRAQDADGLLLSLEGAGFDVCLIRDRRRAWLSDSEREYVIEGRKRGTTV